MYRLQRKLYVHFACPFPTGSGVVGWKSDGESLCVCGHLGVGGAAGRAEGAARREGGRSRAAGGGPQPRPSAG